MKTLGLVLLAIVIISGALRFRNKLTAAPSPVAAHIERSVTDSENAPSNGMSRIGGGGGSNAAGQVISLGSNEPRVLDFHIEQIIPGGGAVGSATFEDV